MHFEEREPALVLNRRLSCGKKYFGRTWLRLISLLLPVNPSPHDLPEAPISTLLDYLRALCYTLAVNAASRIKEHH